MTVGRNVDIGDHFFNDGSAFKQLWALNQHGNANRSFISHTFVDQTMLAKHETIVAHVNDQCFIVNAHLFKFIHDRTNAVVDRAQSFAVLFVIRFDVEFAVVGKINAVPTVALVE